ncbi:MAG: DNA alkylation repair protein, partial [Candidatus Sericytochromatia bacterium]
VDIIATKIVPEYFKLYPDELLTQSKRLNEVENIWQNRISILFQLHYKNKTNRDLLSKYILNHSNSKEFFIQKAIGWSLREYYKTNPEWVIDFVNNNDLKPLSKREALKNHK